jgi:hypothetical protein
MTVPPDDLLLLSRQVAAALDDRITVHALTSTGDSGRAEVLVTISGCHPKPCLLLLNITRSDPGRVRQELTARLRRALEDHLGDHRHSPEPPRQPQAPSATRVLSESAAALDDLALALEEVGAEAGGRSTGRKTGNFQRGRDQ